MKKFLSITAYTWAFVCVLIVPLTFIGNNYFAHKLATLPFMKINPKYSGGEVSRTYNKDSLIISIGKPVFPSLFGSAGKGFVQVKFSGRDKLPEIINQTIDYDNDGRPDFTIRINTVANETEFSSMSPLFTGLNISSRVKNYWLIRADMINPENR